MKKRIESLEVQLEEANSLAATSANGSAATNGGRASSSGGSGDKSPPGKGWVRQSVVEEQVLTAAKELASAKEKLVAMKAKAVSLLSQKDGELRAIEAQLYQLKQQQQSVVAATPSVAPPLATPGAGPDPLPTPPTQPPMATPAPTPVQAGRSKPLELDLLKQLLRRYIEMDEADNDALFKHLVALLEYSSKEKKAMAYARETRIAKRSSFWLC